MSLSGLIKCDFWLSEAKSLWLQRVKQPQTCRLMVNLKSSVAAAWLSFASFLKIVSFTLKDVLFLLHTYFTRIPHCGKVTLLFPTRYKFVTCFFCNYVSGASYFKDCHSPPNETGNRSAAAENNKFKPLPVTCTAKQTTCPIQPHSVKPGNFPLLSAKDGFPEPLTRGSRVLRREQRGWKEGRGRSKNLELPCEVNE